MGKVQAAKPGGTVLPPSAARPKAAPVAAASSEAQPLADLPPELAGHPKFRILRELGRGGMGVIYLAEHRVLEKPVALKVINPAVLDNPDALARFQTEARAAAKLDHQHIARAYDADRAGDLHFLVMEFVEGVSLAQLLEKKGPLSVTAACHCASQAALGLQHAFEQGMVHRDIKPHNLMLTPKGQVKILDFGLARVRDERNKVAPRLTRLESFMGTPTYVAPEQATDAREADTRSDIYSLGCTLYALLAGQPPFTGDGIAEIVLAHIEKEPAPLHEVRPDVPAGLSAVVAKMLAKDPAKRYQRPIDVAQALAPFAKAAGKAAAGSGGSVPPPVRAAGTGTRIGGDTSRVNGPGKQESRSPASGAEPAQGDSPFADLVAAPASSKKDHGSAEPSLLPWWKRPGVMAVAAGASLALILTVVIIKVSVKTPGGETNVEVVIKPSDTRKEQPSKESAKQSPPESGGSDKPLAQSESSYVSKATGMKFVRIPAGKFLMGSPKDEWGRSGDEDQHEVEITRPFGLGVDAVTRGQFRRFVEDEAYKTEAEKHGNCWGWDAGQNKCTQDPKYTWRDPGYEQDDDHPVVEVSWNDAKEFCAWLSKKDGRTYRLPTEAEWEYACRAGTKTDYYSGDGEAALKKVGWYSGNSGNETHPVGLLKKNAWGLYDMHGNVWQWCEDYYGPYQGLESRDPVHTRQDGEYHRVVRGGCFCDSPQGCLAAHRHKFPPGQGDWLVGFRLCLRLD